MSPFAKKQDERKEMGKIKGELILYIAPIINYF